MNYKIGINQRAKEYNCIRYNGKIMHLHRVIWIKHHGNIPKDMVIHHINGNKKDNRIENLECLSKKDHGQRHLKKNRIRIKYPSGAIKVIKVINSR